jgi:hypothetical protein
LVTLRRDDGTIFPMPLDTRHIEPDVDDDVAVTAFVDPHLWWTLGGPRESWEVARTTPLAARLPVVQMQGGPPVGDVDPARTSRSVWSAGAAACDGDSRNGQGSLKPCSPRRFRVTHPEVSNQPPSSVNTTVAGPGADVRLVTPLRSWRCAARGGTPSR